MPSSRSRPPVASPASDGHAGPAAAPARPRRGRATPAVAVAEDSPAIAAEPTPAVRASKPARPVARFRLRVMSGEAIAIGPGKIALLEAIADTGSLTAAAKQLDMSYRRAWLLLDEINKSLKRPAVDSAKGGQHGGGSTLTETGLEIIALYRGIEATAEQACAAPMKRLLSLIAR